MKIILMIFVFGTILSAQPNESKTVAIEKSKSGYNIYSTDGTLWFEYTIQNSDSSTLSTLNQIYIDVKNVDSANTNKIPVVILPSPSSNLTFWIAIISPTFALIGIVIGWFLTDRTKRKELERKVLSEKRMK